MKSKGPGDYLSRSGGAAHTGAGFIVGYDGGRGRCGRGRFVLGPEEAKELIVLLLGADGVSSALVHGTRGAATLGVLLFPSCIPLSLHPRSADDLRAHQEPCDLR